MEHKNIYNCPHCGHVTEYADIIEQKNEAPHIMLNYEVYEAVGMEWDETRHCPFCHTVFTFKNASPDD